MAGSPVFADALSARNLLAVTGESMNRIVIGRWTLEADPDATCAAYSRIPHGSPETCNCDPCHNFAVSRETTYPPAFRRLLVDLGVPCDREAEIYHNGRLETDLHLYGGWFHFVGSIVSGADAFVTTIDGDSGTFDLHRITERFSAGVSVRTALVNQAFNSQSLLQLEFAAEIQWVVEAPEPD